jgi:hypothetical protein
MSRAMIIILSFVVSFNTSLAQSSNNQGGNNQFIKPENDLSKDKLNQEDLVYHEQRAIQKVEEFYGYLNAMANHENKDAVRDRAMQIAERQFDKNALIHFLEKSQSIHDYLLECRNGFNYKEIDTLFISNSLVELSNGSFEGKVLVKFHLQNSKVSLKKGKVTTETVRIILKKREKNFGDTKKIVWELTLAEIF